MDKDRLGFYQVGNKKFYSKPVALMESYKSKKEVYWNFNDDIFEKIDWSIPIEESLENLYIKRARQLREKYDFISLHYSGGADSHNILLTFIDNNILLDEIVLSIPEIDIKNLNGTDLSSRNIYGEILVVAIPELKKLENKLDKRTKITIRDISKTAFEVLKNDDWFEKYPLNSMITPGTIGRQCDLLFAEKVLDLTFKGKTACHLTGVDKPLVLYKNANYFAYFNDASAYHAYHSAPDKMNKSQYDIFNSSSYTEFFYWSRDIPEIVVKQAQEIKKNCELDSFKKFMWSNSLNIHIGKFRKIMHPIIYPKVETPSFQTEKPPGSIIRPVDSWFWNTANNNNKANFLDAIKYLSKNIDQEKYTINRSIMNGFTAINTKFYKL